MDYILSIVILACINMIAVLGLSIFTGFTGLFTGTIVGAVAGFVTGVTVMGGK